MKGYQLFKQLIWSKNLVEKNEVVCKLEIIFKRLIRYRNSKKRYKNFVDETGNCDF